MGSKALVVLAQSKYDVIYVDLRCSMSDGHVVTSIHTISVVQ